MIYLAIDKTSQVSSAYALNLIDTIATFSVVEPSILDGIKTKDVFEMNIIESKPLLDAYNEYRIFMDEWYEELKKTLLDDSKKDNQGG